MCNPIRRSVCPNQIERRAAEEEEQKLSREREEYLMVKGQQNRAVAATESKESVINKFTYTNKHTDKHRQADTIS